MKKVIVLGLCATVLLASSCSQSIDAPMIENISSVETTSTQRSTSLSTTSVASTTTAYTFEEYIPEYELDQTFLNVTFDDVYNLCEELTGVDLEE